MRKIKQWLICQFLPAYAKQTILRENEQLRQQISELRAEISKLNAYIDGVETGIRAQRRIIITTGGATK